MVSIVFSHIDSHEMVSRVVGVPCCSLRRIDNLDHCIACETLLSMDLCSYSREHFNDLINISDVSGNSLQGNIEYLRESTNGLCTRGVTRIEQ